ncbi:MAG: NAD(P)-dependent glycerol-3-phosphate dehydrogenase [Actinobacteria bacterium]|nr:NAD(P)-dependent glycerol-3-phosphate dehydrogenase [Actinomycetota bacterium]
MKVAVVGAGSWGTCVAALASHNADVTLWARRPELAEAIEHRHENPEYLAGAALPEALRATSDLAAAVAGADVVVMGVPSHGYRAVLSECGGLVGDEVPVVSLSKGVEQGSLLRMTEVSAASVVAFADDAVATEMQKLFMTPRFRVYTNGDVVGCETAGALKNVMAIATGIASGLGYGDNSRAALITRGLAELTRLGVALGGNPLTFLGLAGIGDLVATCTSEQSRNRTVGFQLGQGRSLDEIVADMNMVAEGVKSTEAVLALAARCGVEMPIAEQVGAVLYDGRDPEDMVGQLMGREAKPELHGIE